MTDIIHLAHQNTTAQTIRNRLVCTAEEIARHESTIRDKLNAAKKVLAAHRRLSQLRPIVSTLTPDQRRLINTLYTSSNITEQVSIDLNDRILHTKYDYQALRSDIKAYVHSRNERRALIARDKQALAEELLKPALKTRDLNITQFIQTLMAMPHISDVNVSLTGNIFLITFTMSDYQFAIPEEEHGFLEWALDRIYDETNIEIDPNELLSVPAADTQFAVHINMNTLKLVACVAETDTVSGHTYRNPHFLGRGDSCCLGSFEPTIQDAIQQMDFETAVLVITMFAQQYTTQDSAGWGFARGQINYHIEDDAEGMDCEFLSENSYSSLWAQYHYEQDQLKRRTA